MDQEKAPERSVEVCCRLRPLLDSEQHTPADWQLGETSIGLAGFEGKRKAKGEAELRSLDHLKRDVSMVMMGRVFGATATTQDVYNQMRGVVDGLPMGLNGAILAYGQTSSGKTYSMFGPDIQDLHRSVRIEEENGVNISTVAWPSNDRKGIVHFAVEDTFQKMAGMKNVGEFLVRISYVEIYMERVNDLLREISPTSQNLPVKEDPDRGFYVEGVKEKIVTTPEQVLAAIIKAERRRRVAHTRYNEVSSRSHVVLQVTTECAKADDDEIDVKTTRVGRLTLVDLAGNERLSEDTKYHLESSSINKSLFFLGEVIGKLSQRAGGERDVHIPYRDSKLTRLLQSNLGGNSHTAMLVTLHPAVDFIDASLQSLRFASKAGSVKTMVRTNYISKEQSLIHKQRELITDLREQVRALEEEKVLRSTGPTPVPEEPEEPEGPGPAAELARVEQMTVGAPEGRVEYVSTSSEIDAVVMALHRSNEKLRKKAAAREAEVLQLQGRLHAFVAEQEEDLAAWCADPRLVPSPTEEPGELGALRSLWSRTLGAATAALCEAERAEGGVERAREQIETASREQIEGALREQIERALREQMEWAFRERMERALRERTASLREELAKCKGTESSLRADIVQLKKHGKLISEERKQLAAQLGEQRERQEKAQAALQAELQAELDRSKADVMGQINSLKREKSSLVHDDDFALAAALNATPSAGAGLSQRSTQPSLEGGTPHDKGSTLEKGTPRSALEKGTPRSALEKGTPRSITLDFYRQRNVKVDWKPGDMCRRLLDDKVFTVVRLVSDAYPPYVVLRADGVETNAELPLIAPDASFTPRNRPARPSGGGCTIFCEGGRALPIRER